MRYQSILPTLTISLAMLGSVPAPVASCEFLWDWMFGHHKQPQVVQYAPCCPAPCDPCGGCQNGCPTAQPYAVQPYAAQPQLLQPGMYGVSRQTYYRSQPVTLPVTLYRPATTIDPRTGLPTTMVQGCTATTTQVNRVPYCGYQNVYRPPVYGYPVAPGCSTCGVPGGYSAPMTTGYPVTSGYPVTTNYPTVTTGYPTVTTGYAPAAQGYAPAAPGYAPAAPVYAPANPGCKSCGAGASVPMNNGYAPQVIQPMPMSSYPVPVGGATSAPTLMPATGISKPFASSTVSVQPSAPMVIPSSPPANTSSLGLVPVGPAAPFAAPEINPALVPPAVLVQTAPKPVPPPMPLSATHGAPPLLNPANPKTLGPVVERTGVEFPTAPKNSGVMPYVPRTPIQPLPLLPDSEVTAPLPPAEKAPPLFNTGDRTARYSPVRGPSTPIRWEAAPARETGPRLARGQ